jgi:lipoyl(octanoyl) transferase
MTGDAWRFLDSGKESAVFHMALDEAIFRAVSKGDAPPTFRLYEWDPPAVTVGYSQTLDAVVCRERCAKCGFDLTRRLTGGRAVLHHREIAYSVIARTTDVSFGATAADTYRGISMILIGAFVALGIPASWSRGTTTGGTFDAGIGKAPCFLSASRYEITIGGKKVVGSAQRRIGDVFLQQGSILVGPGHERITDCLPDGCERESYERALREKTVDIETATGAPIDIPRLKEALFRSFASFAGCGDTPSLPSDKEIGDAHLLASERYGAKGWLLRHEPKPCL